MREGQSLRQICRDTSMPDRSTVHRWLDDSRYSDFRDQYARAVDLRADHIFDEVIEIADDGVNDFIERLAKDGTTQIVFDSEHVQRSRLRVDARKWILARMSPRKYSDRVVNHNVAEPAPEQIGEDPRSRLLSKIAAMQHRMDEGARHYIENGGEGDEQMDLWISNRAAVDPDFAAEMAAIKSSKCRRRA